MTIKPTSVTEFRYLILTYKNGSISLDIEKKIAQNLSRSVSCDTACTQNLQ